MEISDFDLYNKTSDVKDKVFGKTKIIFFFVDDKEYLKHDSSYGPISNVFSWFGAI
jgi:hypothetical protein